jgi:hypothetical protein
MTSPFSMGCTMPMSEDGINKKSIVMKNTLHFNRYECLPEYSLVVGLNLDEDGVIFSITF